MSLLYCLQIGRRWPCLVTLLLLTSLFLISCSGLSFGGKPTNATPQATAAQVAVGQLHWCGKPLLIFRDEGAPVPASITPTATGIAGTPGTTPTATASPTPSTSKPRTLTDWSQVEPNLGFTVYLPATLPQGACLVSASGTLHDPIFGGSFTIGYLLPDHSSISLAEAPLHNQNPQFQCSPAQNTSSHSTGTPTVSPGTTQAPLQVCSGAHEGTSIILSAHGTTDSLQQFFNTLQPHVKWVPAS